MTAIEWTDATWNPTVGCSRVSPGCDGCYAIGVAHRAMQPAHVGLTEMVCDPRRSRVGKAGDWQAVDWTGEVRCLPDRLDTPLHWRKPRRVFVDSMSDLFHPAVPEEFIANVVATMTTASKHTFQVLTKRPQRMAKVMQAYGRCEGGWLTHNGDEPISMGGTGIVIPVADRAGPTEIRDGQRFGTTIHGPWPLPNVWLGTSVENQQYANLRIKHLLATPAAVRFLSIEPLLGPVDLSRWMCSTPLDAWDGRRSPINWVIVGGESGPGARPMHPQWVRDIRDQCVAAGVPFFFKQWGEWRPPLFTDPEGLRRHDWPPTLAPGAVFAESGGYAVRVGKKAAGRELDGRTWDEMPA